ncbi:MAG: penicillin-binding protein 2 [Thermoanaerobaculia bacterium]
MRQVREHKEDLLQRLPRLQLVLFGVFLLIAARFWFVQVVSGDYYLELAENNRVRELSLKAPRGLIYGRQGRLLAENVPSYNLKLDPSRSQDLEKALSFAERCLNQPASELRQALDEGGGAGSFRPILIAEALSLSEVAAIEVAALEFPEFAVEVGHLRLYRNGPITAHTLGYLGEVSQRDLASGASSLKPGDLVGRKGVELAFDESLRGADGQRAVIVDSRGRFKEEYGREPAQSGQNLKLGLDLDLQQEAARYFEGKAGAAVALDPATGEIRAMVSAPSYNPNIFSRRLDRDAWRNLIEAPEDPLQNRVIQNTYSPGSVFKIVMAAAGLSEGVIDPEQTVWCGGATKIYNRRWRCWKQAGHGHISLHRAIKESCDVYFYHLGQELGIERIAKYSRQLGLGRPTGIDLLGEREGLVPDPDWSARRRGTPWYPGETISVAIGQGPILVTPLQIASLMAAVANSGYQVRPHVVESPSVEKEQLTVEPWVFERIGAALWSVVNDQRGTGSAARVPGIDVAGKTGTVQVVQQKTWIKSEDLPYEQRDHGWFASYATAGDKQLVVVVLVEHGGHGSTAAAPLAKRLYEIYFRDYLDNDQSS